MPNPVFEPDCPSPMTSTGRGRDQTANSELSPVITDSDYQKNGGRQLGQFALCQPLQESVSSSPGLELRVHGIGDHDTYSALGRPDYIELVASRVWIGQVPSLPEHRLRLLNWSRANRKFSRHLGWYIAFPFTLLNVAGYMEPVDDQRWRWRAFIMRFAIGVSGICLTISMAAWLTVIIETFWRGVTTDDDRLTGVLLQAAGPGILIAGIIFRFAFGRIGVDRGASGWGILNLLALVAMIGILHDKPSSWNDTWIGRLVNRGTPNHLDAMLMLVVASVTVVLTISIAISSIALIIRIKADDHPESSDVKSASTSVIPLCGAALLLPVSIVLIHSIGSLLRLAVDTLSRLAPWYTLSELPEHKGLGSSDSIGLVLLPQADDLQSVARYHALPIDLIPIFGAIMSLIFGLAVAIAWIRHRSGFFKGSSGRVTDEEHARRLHDAVIWIPKNLASPILTALVFTVAAWLAMYWAFGRSNTGLIDGTILWLQVLGVVAFLLLIARQPKRLAKRFRIVFGYIADVAGFWAPDVHPLAGTSYRSDLISGLRQAIAKSCIEEPDKPIALVGHSQGSVICAWFVRGGHWFDQHSEGQNDRRNVKKRTFDVNPTAPSDRIALFTCGSPLETLYRKFFPRFFDDEFFRKTRQMTYSGNEWRNYWRATDPIGSSIEPLTNPPGGPAVDRDIPEENGRELRRHGEYWSEYTLRNDIDEFFATSAVRRVCQIGTNGLTMQTPRDA